MQYWTQRRTNRKAIGVFLALAALGLGACAVETGELDTELATRTQGLRCADTGDPDCHPWNEPMHRYTPYDGLNDLDHRKSPASLVTQNGWMVVSVDALNQYRTLQFRSIPATSWGSYGTKAFASKPAVAPREASSGLDGFVLAGKATDNKLYASAGRYSASTNPPTNSVPVEPWTQVSSTSYSVNGNPAMASNSVAMVMVLMGDDLRTIYAHVRNLPYIAPSNSWSARITGPVLPTGWKVYGSPSILFLGATFLIVVHAENDARTVDRLYATHFYAGGGTNPKHFSSNIGSPPGTWTQLPSLGVIDDDPSVTVHLQHGFTIYFRRGNALMQTSAASYTSWNSAQVVAIPVEDVVEFRGSPAAVANGPVTTNTGSHVVVMKTKDAPAVANPPTPAVLGHMYRAFSQVNEQVIP